MQSSSKQEGVKEPSAKANETEAVNNKKDSKTIEASANGGNNKGNSATATITEPKQEGTKVEANKGTETSSEVKGDTENSAEVLKNVAGSKHRVKSGNGDNEKPEGIDNSTPGKTPQGQEKLNNLKNEANKVVQGVAGNTGTSKTQKEGDSSTLGNGASNNSTSEVKNKAEIEKDYSYLTDDEVDDIVKNHLNDEDKEKVWSLYDEAKELKKKYRDESDENNREKLRGEFTAIANKIKGIAGKATESSDYKKTNVNKIIDQQTKEYKNRDNSDNAGSQKYKGYPQGNLRKHIILARKNALEKAKTPEERAKILRDYKAMIDDPSYSPENIKADGEKFQKAYKKHESKIKALNKRESELENLLRKKGSESDKEKYRKEIEEIKKTRDSFYEKD